MGKLGPLALTHWAMFQATKKAAFSLIEVIVAVAIFAIFGTALLTATLGVPFSIENSEDRLAARYLEQEAQEALRAMRSYDWNELNTGTHGLDESSGYWQFSGSSDSFDKFTRSIVVTDINSYRKQAVITISWTTDEGKALSTSSTMRLTNWKELVWTIESQSSFDNGYYNSTQSQASNSVDVGLVGSWSIANISLTENTGGNGNVQNLIGDKNHLYVMTANNSSDEEFLLYDISDVSQNSISELGSAEIGSHVWDGFIYEGYAFLASAANSGELTVVDVSDTSLNVVDTVNISGNDDGYGIAQWGTDYAVLARESGSGDEILIYDITDPSNVSSTTPTTLSMSNNMLDVAVDGDYAFAVTDHNTELRIIDLTTPSEVNSIGFSGGNNANVIEIDQDNDIAYIGRAGGEFIALDISSPSTASTSDILGSVTVSGNINDIHIHNGYAYIASNGNTHEIEVIDLSTYTIDSTIDLSDNADGWAVWFQGKHIYGGSSDNDKDLQVVSSGSNGWSSSSIVDNDNPGGNQNMYDIVLGSSGDYAYMGRDSNGSCNTSTGQNCEFLIYDVSSPTSVSLVGALEIGDDVNDVFVDSSENYAYLATDGTELQVVDISTKSSPSTLGSGYNANSGSNGESVWGSSDGNYVYLGTRTNSGTCSSALGTNCELYIINITVPSLPVYVGGVEIGQNVLDIAVNGVYAYLATNGNSEEINAIDLSTPAAPGTPVTVNHSGSADSNGLYYDTTNNYLHLTTQSNGSNNDYSIYSVSGTSLTLLGGLDTDNNSRGVHVFESDDLAFIAGDGNNEEFRVIDISSPSSPSEIATLDLDADANGIAGDGTYLYLASEHNSQEFQVVGQGSVSTTYALESYYQSAVFDSSSSSTNWGDIDWTKSGSGSLEFQIRTASSSGGIEDATWVGSDGTSATTYSSTGSVTTDSGASGTRYIQLLAIFSSDGSTNPTLEDVSITYTQ